MSTILTRSKFYYGAKITKLTSAIDFDEGGAEINATMKVGDYTMLELAVEMARAMSEVGGQDYTATFNRATREITISAPSNFTLRTATGSRAFTSAWTMLGFNGASDYTGSNSYAGELKAAYEYEAQYPFDKYSSSEHNIVRESGTVNTSATGNTQQIYFADGSRVEMNMKLITNRQLSSCQKNFKYNANGVADFLFFMNKIMAKGKLELMPDVDTPSNFVKLILLGTKEDRAGLQFELKNMKYRDFYESGVLVFRKVIES